MRSALFFSSLLLGGVTAHLEARDYCVSVYTTTVYVPTTVYAAASTPSSTTGAATEQYSPVSSSTGYGNGRAGSSSALYSGAPTTGAIFVTVNNTGGYYGTGQGASTVPSATASDSTPAETSYAGTDPVIDPAASKNRVKYMNAVYFTNWGIYGANYQPQSLPASKLTHVLYAFADIGSDGTVKTSDSYADLEKHYSTDSWNDQGKNAYGCIKQLYILKKKNRKMKLLLSIGGWTWSSKFGPVVATASGRQTFANSAVKLIGDWGFDGIDIDWEYPQTSTEAQNFVLLLKACREALDAYSKKYASNYHFLLTVASPAGPQNYQKMDIKGMDKYLDTWHLMAYDYAGSWDSTTGHQANLLADKKYPYNTKFNTEDPVNYYVKQGVKSSKIILGMPLYGRSFESTNGLGQSYSGIGSGTTQAGVWSYKVLPRSGATEFYDNTAKASYSYDSKSKELISYDNVNSAKVKAQYLVSKGLGGAFFWEASGDKTDSKSLLGLMSSTLQNLDSNDNLLKYPNSQYANIKNGMPGS